MGEQARSAPCVAWVNAKKSIHAPSIQPFLFAAGNLRNMTNPFSEYSQFDALTVSDLIFFVSLFESRSLSNTAAEGGLSLSTASRTLRKLRETFGDPLFLRSSPDFVPTSRATELYPKVAMLLENLRRLERPACFDPATLTRTFRIGVVDNAVCAVMSGVVKAFFEAAPRASLSFRQITDSLFDDLADGTLDCAVYPETHSTPSGIQDLLLYPISYALCVRKGHPLVEATDFTAVMPMQTARLFEERDGIVAIPIHPDPESGRGRDAFNTRLIWHERVADEPALQWLRGLFAVHAHWEDPKAKTGA